MILSFYKEKRSYIRNKYCLSSNEKTNSITCKIQSAANYHHFRAAQPFKVKSAGRMIAESSPVVSNGTTCYQASFDTHSGENYRIVR